MNSGVLPSKLLIVKLSIAKKSCEGTVKKESTPCEKEPKI